MLVESNSNPILLNEQEIIYEGLIDSIKSGFKYLKDRNAIKKYEKYLNSIGNMKANLSDKDREELRKKSAEINKLRERTKQFQNWFKFMKSPEGRNYFRLANNKDMPKLDATSDSKFTNPYINTAEEPEVKKQNPSTQKTKKSKATTNNTKKAITSAANNKKSKVPATKNPITNKSQNNNQMYSNMPIPSQNPFV